jgi:hypothetical protein
MLPPLSVPHPPPLTLLLLLDAPPDRAWGEALHALSAALPDAEPLLLGHGPPGPLAPALRSLAAGPAQPRVELGTQAQGRTAALVAGVRAARTPWVLWMPRAEAAAAERAHALRRRADAAAGGVFFGDDGGACLFRRDALLQLPRIPGMHRLLPELFTRHAAAPAAPGPGRLRRAYVAFACTMGLGWTPARRIA